jgi:hypothetical protein
MKLVKQKNGTRQYALNPIEADLLKHLLENFPFTGCVPAKISKTDTDPKSIERQKLLNESMAEHRKELKKQARKLVSAEQLIPNEKGHLLRVNAEDREILLQILNDIRVGCWQALGEPEKLESDKSKYSKNELIHHHLVNLAGYFEHHLVA